MVKSEGGVDVFALGIVTPWGGTVVPFYEVGRERSEPDNP